MSLFGVTWIAPKAAANPPVVVNAVIFFIPWSLLAALLAFLFLKDVPIKANVKEQLDIFGNPNTWYMTVLYIMTFGLFSGFGAQTALIINNNFGKLSPLAESFNPDTLPVGLSSAPSSARSCASPGGPCATSSVARSGPLFPPSEWRSHSHGAAGSS